MTSQPYIDPNFDFLAQMAGNAMALDTAAQDAAATAYAAPAGAQRGLFFAAATAYRAAAQSWRLACGFYRNAFLPQSFQYAANATADEAIAAQLQQLALTAS